MNSINDNVVSILLSLGAWMFTYLIHSTILFFLVNYLVKLRLFGANRVKEYLWKFALIGGVFTASIQTYTGVNRVNSSLPVYTIPVSSGVLVNPERVPDPGDAVLNGSNPITGNTEARSYIHIEKAGIPPATRAFTIDFTRAVAILVGIWVLVSLCLLIRKTYHLRKFVAELNPLLLVQNTSLLSLASNMQKGRKVRNLNLYVTRHQCSPMAINHNSIVLPERVESLPVQSQKALLAHEYAHLLRNDPFWLNVYNLFSCLFFLQPLTKRIVSKLNVLAELLCDKWAAEQTKDPRAMALCLVEVASWLQSGKNTEYAYAMASMPSALQLRVESILSKEKKFKQKPRYSLIASLLMFILVSFAVPGISFQEQLLPAALKAVPARVTTAAGASTIKNLQSQDIAAQKQQEALHIAELMQQESVKTAWQMQQESVLRLESNHQRLHEVGH